jgi:hypothetical protein
MYDTDRNRGMPYGVDLLVGGCEPGGAFLYNIGMLLRSRMHCLMLHKVNGL